MSSVTGWTRLALGVVAAALLAGCSGTSASKSPPAPASAYSPGVESACSAVASAIDSGRLADAEQLLGAPPITEANPSCAVAATALVADRRASAQALVDAARAKPAEAALLAASALRLDADNAQARAIADVAGLPPAPSRAPIPAPALTFPPEATATPTTDACEPAREALSEGRLSEAAGLIDAVDAKVDCVAEVKAAIAEKRAAQPLVRSWRSVSDDRLPQLLLVAALVLVGAVLARATTAGRRPSRLKRGRWAPAVTGALLVVCIAGPAIAQLVPAFVEWLPGGLLGAFWDVATALAALAFGYAQVRYLRASSPTTVEVIDTSGKSVDNSTFGTLVVSEVSTMAEDSPGGLFAVRGGTDLSDSGVNAALDTITQKYLKAAVTVWRAVTTGLGDRVQINLVGTESDPVAAVSIRRGARTVYEERIDTRELRVDKVTATEIEKASVTQDLATAVASRVVLEHLGLVGTDLRNGAERGVTEGHVRLYGVTDPRSLAVAAVAARHSERSRFAEAVELFARAHGLDPGNQAARYGRNVNALRLGAAGADGLVALQDLEALAAELRSGHRDSAKPLPLWWRCAYNVSIHRANRIITGGIPDPGTGSMNQIVVHRAALMVLAAHLAYWGSDDSGMSAGDRRLARRLERLARCVVPGLLAVERMPSEDVRRRLGRLETHTSMRGMVNIANAYALLWRRREHGGAREDLLRAVELIRLAGLERGMRADIMGDPVLALLKNAKPYREVVTGWGLHATDPYASLTCLGSTAAAKLERPYPTARALRSALRREPHEVFRRAEVGAENLPWWTGALDWLLAGRDVATINTYQAAGIRDAAQAQGLGDGAVVARLHRRQKDDPTVVIPDARTRALMRA